MVIKVYEGVASKRKYEISYEPNVEMMHEGCFRIENENGAFVFVDEKSLFDVIDLLINMKLKRDFDECNRA